MSTFQTLRIYRRVKVGFYLAVTIDLFSRLVVGWSLSTRMFTRLVTDALEMAVEKRDPGPGLMHHNDRCVQFTSDAFQAILEEHGYRGSMSRKGDCWDNAELPRIDPTNI